MSAEPSRMGKVKKEWGKLLKKPSSQKTIETGQAEIEPLLVQLQMELAFQAYLGVFSNLAKSQDALAKLEAALAEEKQKVETFTKTMCEIQAAKSELEKENKTLTKTIKELEQKLKEATEKINKEAPKIEDKGAGPAGPYKSKFVVPETLGFVPETPGFMTETEDGGVSQVPVRSDQGQQAFAKTTPTKPKALDVPETQDEDDVVQGSPVVAGPSSQTSSQGKKRRKKLMRKKRENSRLGFMNCSTSSSNTDDERRGAQKPPSPRKQRPPTPPKLPEAIKEVAKAPEAPGFFKIPTYPASSRRSDRNKQAMGNGGRPLHPSETLTLSPTPPPPPPPPESSRRRPSRGRRSPDEKTEMPPPAAPLLTKLRNWKPTPLQRNGNSNQASQEMAKHSQPGVSEAGSSSKSSDTTDRLASLKAAYLSSPKRAGNAETNDGNREQRHSPRLQAKRNLDYRKDDAEEELGEPSVKRLKDANSPRQPMPLRGSAPVPTFTAGGKTNKRKELFEILPLVDHSKAGPSGATNGPPKKIPDPSFVPGYAFKPQTVRNKQDRARMSAYTCQECAAYFATKGLDGRKLEEEIKRVCKHRGKAPPPVPAHFWDMSF